jgi:hypothetical protein
LFSTNGLEVGRKVLFALIESNSGQINTGLKAGFFSGNHQTSPLMTVTWEVGFGEVFTVVVELLEIEAPRPGEQGLEPGHVKMP